MFVSLGPGCLVRLTLKRTLQIIYSIIVGDLCVCHVTEDFGVCIAIKVVCCIIVGKRKRNTICVFKLNLSLIFDIKVKETNQETVCAK